MKLATFHSDQTATELVDPAEGGHRGLVIGVVSGIVLFLALGGVILWLALRRKPQRAEPCRSCGRVLMPTWEKCMFCGRGRNESKAELSVVTGPLNGQKIALDLDITTFGSGEGNTILLDDTGVSRKHVGIRKVHDRYELADLGSTNGVYVNGQRVARHRLQLGDVIRVGATEMVFRS